MAYPTVDAPYGLKPINLVGGQVPLPGQLVKSLLLQATTQTFLTETL